MSGTLRPTSASLMALMICSSLNLLVFIGISLWAFAREILISSETV